MKNIIFALFYLSLFSCSSSSERGESVLLRENPIEAPAPDANLNHKALFTQFVKKFRPVNFPLDFRTTYNNSLDLTGLEKLSSSSYDTLFAKAEFLEESYSYGMLPDTSSFYSLIYIFPAAQYYPVLATYTKSGNLISQESLFIGSCGADCGLVACSMTGTINKDFSIVSVDSMLYEYHCDNSAEPIQDSGELIVISKSGKIDKKGKVTMTQEKRTEKSIKS